MKPRIQTLSEKKLVGIHQTMSLANYKIGELWRRLSQRRNEITNNLNNDLISLALYKPTYFEDFNQTKEFERWAAVEVSDFDNVPDEFETFVLQKGLYAVFDYKGLSSDNSIFHYIFETWLPNSNYILDDRPHFEVLGENYKNDDPTSEEEIWIPIRPKQSNN